MRAPLKIVLVAGLGLAAACASLGPPGRFASIPAADAQECAVIKAALSGVLNEQPYYSKAVEPPMISYIAITPYLAVDPFEENPFEYLKDQEPVNLAPCVGGQVKGERFRIMSFKYPERIRNEEIIDPDGWVSRPVIEGDKATVLLSRGQCYRTTTIELSRSGEAWTPASIRHTKSDTVWFGRDPCSPWP